MSSENVMFRVMHAFDYCTYFRVCDYQNVLLRRHLGCKQLHVINVCSTYTE